MTDATPLAERELVLTRLIAAPRAKLWRAWTETAELGRWYVGGDDHIVHRVEADVRVGGEYLIAWGPPDAEPVVERGRYTEIIPMRRLACDVGVNGEDLAHGHYVVEFRDLGDGRTELILTDTSVEAWRSGQGWTPCLRSLARYLAG